MKLVFLHGAPASGKRTVGVALGRLCHAPLFDNHVAIDFARVLFEFGTPDFWDLVMEVRLAALRAAASADMSVLITTAAYSDPVDRPLYGQYETVMAAAGAEILPVYLTCRTETLLERVATADRAARGKIMTPDRLVTYLDQNSFTPVPRDTCLTVDTNDQSPNSAAAHIAEHFDLVG
ncbi:hypothetical protein [uncultured Tateyamaria sp.]|uniref:hypothetical protein n=1 Tax=uncultured Tateyamaria sp. TaxID=455651 RepID=UPI0026256371|nr:hypothetical protein [uncultured Tateyamaria sp.]